MSDPARCTCGSGGHPRECATHPEEYARHVAELDAENVRDDLERRLAAWRPIVEAALAQERASTVATPIGVIHANLGPSEALREYRARCALTNAVARALPPEHRPAPPAPEPPA